MSRNRQEGSGGQAPGTENRGRRFRLGTKTLAMLVAAAGAGYAARSFAGDNVDQAALNAIRGRQEATDRKIEKAVTGLARINGVRIHTLLGKGLDDPSGLPGQGERVSDKQRGKLAASAVSILMRPRGASDHWRYICSGTKVSIDDNPYILTAQHCLGPMYDSSQVKPHSYAANVLDRDPDHYAIGQATSDSIIKNKTPMAYVTGASVIVGGHYRPDMALLKVRPAHHNYESASFDGMPSIPLKDYAKEPPEPGSQVAFYSVPSASNKLAVSGLGTYLGRIKSPDDPFMVDVFGLKVMDARHDPAEHGGSGSGSIGANGHMFGDLVYRFGRPGEANRPMTQPDYPYDEAYRLREAQSLGVDVSQYSVIANAVVPPPFVFDELVNGFDNRLPALFPAK